MISNKLILLLSLMILFSCYRKRQKFDSEKNYKDVTKAFVDTLFYKGCLEKASVVDISLHIQGVINGEAKLLLHQRPYSSSGYEVLLKGNLNKNLHFYDWYDEEILLKYVPIDSVFEGNIRISYSFGVIGNASEVLK